MAAASIYINYNRFNLDLKYKNRLKLIFLQIFIVSSLFCNNFRAKHKPKNTETKVEKNAEKVIFHIHRMCESNGKHFGVMDSNGLVAVSDDKFNIDILCPIRTQTPKHTQNICRVLSAVNACVSEMAVNGYRFFMKFL